MLSSSVADCEELLFPPGVLSALAVAGALLFKLDGAGVGDGEAVLSDGAAVTAADGLSEEIEALAECAGLLSLLPLHAARNKSNAADSTAVTVTDDRFMKSTPLLRAESRFSFFIIVLINLSIQLFEFCGTVHRTVFRRKALHKGHPIAGRPSLSSLYPLPDFFRCMSGLLVHFCAVIQP